MAISAQAQVALSPVPAPFTASHFNAVDSFDIAFSTQVHHEGVYSLRVRMWSESPSANMRIQFPTPQPLIVPNTFGYWIWKYINTSGVQTNLKNFFISNTEGEIPGDNADIYEGSIWQSGGGNFGTTTCLAESVRMQIGFADGQSGFTEFYIDQMTYTASKVIIQSFGDYGNIHGWVGADTNQNQMIDEGEILLPDWKIFLSRDNGGGGKLLVDSAITDNVGHWTFNGPQVPFGTYYVYAETKSCWTQTVPIAPDTFTVVIGPGSLDTTLVFGEYAPAVVLLSNNTRWNLVSLPVFSCLVGTVSNIFPLATSPAYAYTETGYQEIDTLVPGVGYWVKFPTQQTTAIAIGNGILSDTVSVTTGWNLIGAITSPIAAGDVTVDPPSLVSSQFFSYQNRYQTSDTLYPGKGYWVKVSESGQFVMTAAASGLKKGTIHIVPTNELPPSPPNEIASPELAMTPKEFRLEQNYPNPFNPATMINYSLPATSYVTLTVYNMLGQEVATLVNEQQSAGEKSIKFDATNLSSGIYVYRLTANAFTEVKKMILIK